MGGAERGAEGTPTQSFDDRARDFRQGDCCLMTALALQSAKPELGNVVADIERDDLCAPEAP